MPREERQAELEALTPDQLLHVFQQVHGMAEDVHGIDDGLTPAQPARIIQTILDREYRQRPDATVQLRCPACQTQRPHRTEGVYTHETGERYEAMECASCGTVTNVATGDAGEQFQQNVETPDNTHLEAN